MKGRGLFHGLSKSVVTKSSDDEDDEGMGLAAMAPGSHYTSKRDVGADGGEKEDQGRGRGRSRGGDGDRGQSRSRSASVSRAFRRLVGGFKNDKAKVEPDGSMELQDNSGASSRSLLSRKPSKAVRMRRDDDDDDDKSVASTKSLKSRRKKTRDTNKDTKKKKKTKSDDASLSVDSLGVDEVSLNDAPSSPGKKKKKKKVKRNPSGLTGLSINVEDDNVSKAGSKNTKKKTRKKSNIEERSLSGSFLEGEGGEKPKRKSRVASVEEDDDAQDLDRHRWVDLESTHEPTQQQQQEEEKPSASGSKAENEGSKDANVNNEDDDLHKYSFHGRGSDFLAQGETDSDSDIYRSSDDEAKKATTEKKVRRPRKENTRNNKDGREASSKNLNKLGKKKLDELDNFTSGLGERDTEAAVAAATAPLNMRIEKQREENEELQKSLANALSKIETLKEDLVQEELNLTKSQDELLEVRGKLNTVSERNEVLEKDMEKTREDLEAKEERIESLENVVENQLDRIEDLEDKLEQTEDEIFQMEDELKELQEKGKLAEDQDHNRRRMERMDSIRMQRQTRANSVKWGKGKSFSLKGLSEIDEDGTEGDNKNLADAFAEMGDASARSSLLSKSQQNADVKRRMSELENWAAELKEREQQIEADQQQELARLDEWERELRDKEQALSNLPQPEAKSKKEQDLEERERKLEREKAEFAKIRAARDTKRVPDMDNSVDVRVELLEKEEEIAILRAECEKLLEEKDEVVRRQEVEEQQRDEDLRLIQEEINEKLQTLDAENHQLRAKLGIGDETVETPHKLQATIKDLEAEVSRLKKRPIVSGDGGGQLQEEITEQLAELDEENQRLSDKLIAQQKDFDKRIREKEHVILGLKKNGSAQGGNDRAIKDLEAKIEEIREEHEAKIITMKRMHEEEKTQATISKDVQIRQLTDELEFAKREFEETTTTDYTARLKREIRSLKDGHKELKKKLKGLQQSSAAKMKKKEENVSFMQKELAKMRREVETLQMKEKRRAAGVGAKPGGNVQRQIEELEDEIDHWKAVNMELEDEVAVWKAEANDWKQKANDLPDSKIDDDSDDDISIGSMQSFASRMSTRADDPLNASIHSISSITHNDLFFVSDKTNLGTLPPPSGAQDSDSASQRALRTVTGLWSQLTAPQPAARANPAIPNFGRGLDD